MVSRRGTGLHLDLKTILTAYSRFEYLVTAGDEATTFCTSGVLGAAGGLLDATTCIVKWSGKFGQRAKMYPTRTNGYENDKTTELFRPV